MFNEPLINSSIKLLKQGEVFKVTDKKDLLTSTTVDPLPYMNYDPVICKVCLTFYSIDESMSFLSTKVMNYFVNKCIDYI